ncbi:Uncharacterized protein TPAR_01950 [Tolypocladium paradoxum]|uniref:Extracellular serine-rich protein n=1 Tax=Tolypocladium paradoxum TaxID=94208 RepID=A0A2S4L5Z4_9HYPO|nr:Uncharacterized protein TPAR_01950 [Tolypocladium paradoxum]
MRFTSLVVGALLSVAQGGVAQATVVHVVRVGKNPMNNQTDLKFYPEKITAKPGEVVQFQFLTGNHTVTQSTFDKPCVRISSTNSSAAGVFSSFLAVADSAPLGQIPVFDVTVNDTNPLWFFCGQGPHCQRGMAMVINENTSANSSRSLENYKNLAKAAVDGAAGIPGIPAAAGGSTSAARSSFEVSTGMLLILGAAFMLL